MTVPWEPSNAGGVEARSPFTGALSWGRTGPSSPVLTRHWVQAPWEGAGTRGEGTFLVEAVLEAVRVAGWRCPHMQGMVPLLLRAVWGPNLGDRGEDLAVTLRGTGRRWRV